MIVKVTRGARMDGLMSYLQGEGRENEHTNPHVVAGHDVVLESVVAAGELSPAEAAILARVLEQPRAVHGVDVLVPEVRYDEESGERIETGKKPAHVWHCSLSLGAGEGELSDEKWQQIASEFVDRMGFTDPEGAQGCRWVAVRHGLSKNGNDHVHIAVNLVREDGTKASVHNDFKRASVIANDLEKKHGLQVIETRELGRREHVCGAGACCSYG